MPKDYSIESIIGIHGYRNTQLIDIGGKIKQRNEDFVVREILPNGKPIFDGSEIGEDLGGMYIHCVLWKTGLDTFSAIKELSNTWKITEKDFGFAGIKDAAAETYQRVSIWNIDKKSVKTTNIPNIKLIHPIRQKFAVKIGDLKGNFFRIVIREIKREFDKEVYEKAKTKLETNGVLNFYGPQRFGSKRPVLHLIGKSLLKEKYSDAIDIYLGRTSPLEHENITKLRVEYLQNRSFNSLLNKFSKRYSIEKSLLKGLEKGRSAKSVILNLPKPFLRLSISAYQAFLFNRVLSNLNKSGFPLLNDVFIPLPGYQTNQEFISNEIVEELTFLLEKDGLDFNSFKHSYRNLRSKGGLRPAIIFPSDLNFYQIDNEGDNIEITFCLPKGSYGTIIIREIIRTEV